MGIFGNLFGDSNEQPQEQKHWTNPEDFNWEGFEDGGTHLTDEQVEAALKDGYEDMYPCRQCGQAMPLNHSHVR